MRPAKYVHPIIETELVVEWGRVTYRLITFEGGAYFLEKNTGERSVPSRALFRSIGVFWLEKSRPEFSG